MSKPGTVRETGDLLQELRSTAARIQEQNARLERETAQRKSALTRDGDAELKRLQEGQEAARDTLAKELAAIVARLDARRYERASRIARADASSRKRALGRIDEKEGRRKFAVQKGTLDTEKFRDTRLAELEREFQEFSGAWQEEQNRLAHLRAAGRKALRAYWTFPRLLDRAIAVREFHGQTSAGLLEETRSARSKAESELRRFRARVLPVLFRFLPIWLWWLLGIGLYLAGPARLGLAGAGELGFRQAIAGVVIGFTIVYFIGWPVCAGVARAFAALVQEAEQALEAAHRIAEAKRTDEIARTKGDAADRLAALRQEWEASMRDAGEERARLESNLQPRIDRAIRRNDDQYAARRSAAEEAYRARMGAGQAEDQAAVSSLRAVWQERIRGLEVEYGRQRKALETEWNEVLGRVRLQLESSRAFAETHFRPWSGEALYHPAEASLDAFKFGEAQLEVPSPLGAGEKFGLVAPLMLVLPAEASMFIETDGTGRPEAIQCLNNIVFRVLQTVPPGKASFTFIDPVHLGQSFSSIMHLADYEENIVHRRIWTEPAEIEERLLELNAHMEKVIQMYLRNEFADIVEYNKKAGRIAEKYHFVVLADFPANISDTAMRRLQKIAASGARCGVYMLIHSDKRLPLPPGFDAVELIQASIHIQVTGREILIPRLGKGAATIRFDSPPGPDLATRFLQEVGEASRGSNTVQVPFVQIAPAEGQRWTLNTTDELRVPIGRSGANKLQYMSLGKGTRQHVLIAGKTGSGKSTLFHVLITNLALWSSPEQVEFYLVDFKKGVEFKDYGTAKLPHARVIAIESDREFGLSVLRRVDEELRVRGELFRAAGAQDLAGYKRASQNGRMPRVLLIIDEFQELFTEDDALAQNAALLLDRIVRQGRAFGIHVVLGSQTLGGAYSLARSTLGQMVVRIALQCSEADAYLIMDESNPAPRLLSRPGEGIYNDSGGSVEANSPFQVVWLPEGERREALRAVRSLAEESGEQNVPIVFEGNSLAEMSANPELSLSLESGPGAAGIGGEKVWLGLPNEIKGPTQVALSRRSGKNLLVAGQHDDHVRALLAGAMISLAAQNSADAVRFVLLENQAAGSDLSLAGVAALFPHESRVVKGSESAEVFRTLAEEVDRREAGSAGPRIFIVIHNLSAFKPLRPEDEFSISLEDGKNSPAADFQRVYAEGPVHGIHVIAHVDGFNNANRFLGRKGLKEFSSRVLFQMSASDSASLADDPRAGNLGLNRALLYDEQEGTYELFRPYARPEANWLAEVKERLRHSRPAGESKTAGAV